LILLTHHTVRQPHPLRLGQTFAPGTRIRLGCFSLPTCLPPLSCPLSLWFTPFYRTFPRFYCPIPSCIYYPCHGQLLLPTQCNMFTPFQALLLFSHSKLNLFYVQDIVFNRWCHTRDKEKLSRILQNSLIVIAALFRE